MEESDPTAPWHPTSAPEIEALRLTILLIAVAASGMLRIRSDPSGARSVAWRKTVGTVPASPFVGAVRDAAAIGVFLVDNCGAMREPV